MKEDTHMTKGKSNSSHKGTTKIKSRPFEKCILLLTLMAPAAIAQTPKFLVHPVSINTTDGTTVEFTCTTNNNPTTIFFLVNGTGVSVDGEEKGFVELTLEDLGGDMRRRTLLVTASVADNNNTQIKCRAVGNVIVDSNAAALLVQGPLSSVADLSSNYNKLFDVEISWSPPFTLNGTDITGYNISVTSNGTTTNYFTSDSYYVLLLTDITDSPCNEIIITVSGYNGLDGKTESLTGIYLPSAKIGNPVPMSIRISNEQQISAKFNISGLCVSQYPENATFFLIANGILTTDNPSSFSLSMDNFTIDNVLKVSEDTVYTLIASLSNLAGPFDHNSTATFNTSSILSVAITDTTDGRVCVECVFASFSSDSGCTVELVSNNTALQYTETFSRSNTDSTVASGCISDVIPGKYRVRVLDGEGNLVDRSLLPSDITVTNVIRATTTTILTTTEQAVRSDTSTPSHTLMLASENFDGNVIVVIGVTAAIVLILLITIGIIAGFIIFKFFQKKGKNAYIDLVEILMYKSKNAHRGSTDSRKALFNLQTKFTPDEMEEEAPKYAELNLNNQARAAPPQPSVEYGQVVHDGTVANEYSQQHTHDHTFHDRDHPLVTL